MKKEGSILIVDDNKELLLAFKMLLSKYFEKVQTESSPKILPSLLSREYFDVVLLDMNFSAGINTGNEGFYWKKEILKYDPDASVVFITAYGDIKLAVKAMKEGVVDFIHKSWDEDKIVSSLLSAYQLRKSKQEISKLKSQQKHLNSKLSENPDVCATSSAQMQKVYSLIEKVAPTEANILITGENGTGKEVAAKMVHQLSNRCNQIFMHVDLGSLSENLFESELFGHEKGAFTDAREKREGRFELASGGTLFLDEIGNLPLSLQAKLLSAIQNKEVFRLGSSKPIKVDIRLICATNKNLIAMVAEGSFREDLLYRINTIHVSLPSLRDRKEDIEQLAEFFVSEFSSKYNKDRLKLSIPAVEKLLNYRWPGNIRELKHAMEKTVILAESNIIRAEDIGMHNQLHSKPADIDTFDLEANEKRIIQLALEKFDGNISYTAQKLGINRTTLYAKMKKYGL